MRVLFVNGRPDWETNPGGDTIQLRKTKSALEGLGVSVEVRNLDQLQDLPACEVAHVFNIQMPESAWCAFQDLKARGIPLVLSPIYWDMFPYWFELAVGERARWRWLVRLAGRRASGCLYVRWQRLKAPASDLWRIQRRLLEAAVRILPNSQSEADLLRATFKLGAGFPAKVDVVPNGIDTALFNPAPKASDSFLKRYGVRDFVLEVGTLYPVKNQLGLIEALFDLPVPLVFVGPSRPDMQDYAAACRSRGAQRGNTVFISHMPHVELPGIYSLAKVHALPSWRETPGLVSLEAAASGCRIVSTSIGSARDYFGGLAWYCHPGDRSSIRKAVESALASPAPERLRQHVLSRFTWVRAAEATRDSYDKALAAKSSGFRSPVSLCAESRWPPPPQVPGSEA